MLDELLASFEALGAQYIGRAKATRDEIFHFEPGVFGKLGAEFIYQVLRARKQRLSDHGLKTFGAYPDERLKTICF